MTVAISLLFIILSGSPEVHGFLESRQAAPEASNLPPERWSETENMAWKKDIAGLAWSSPIVVDGSIILTTAVSSGEVREPRKGLYLEDLNANAYPPETTPYAWKVISLDLETGEVRWEKTAHEGVPPKPHHIKNTLASETPATDGKRIYASFGNIGLFVYDLTGKLVWSLPLPAKNTKYAWGTSISPIVHEGKVYLVNDNEEESYLLCLDAATGKELWKKSRDEKTNYATPYVWKNDRRVELVTSGIGWARSYDMDGNLLWQLKGRSILAIPTPFAEKGLLYLTSGHVAWGQNPVYAIKPGASGDISPPEADGSTEYIAWTRVKGGPYHPTPIIVGDQLYILHDRGLLASYDASTGDIVYDRKRLPTAGFTSSPWSYGGKIFCLSEDGGAFAVQSGKEFKVLHVNKLAEDDMCMATPVIVGDRLLIRTSKRVYCVR